VPIPKPKPNEDEEKFISRCMSNNTMKSEFPKHKQRLAICYSQFRRKKEKVEITPSLLEKIVMRIRNDFKRKENSKPE